MALAWSGARPDAGGSTSFNLEEDTFLSPLESRRAVFQEVAGTKAAGGNYAKIEAGVVREERLPKNWSLLLRADGQWASEPLISNEQLPLGGSGGVRGYREGEAYGDTGWRGMFDVRAPPLRIGGFPYHAETIPAYARLSWFMDSGQALRLQTPGAPGVTELGTGFGVFVTAGEHFDARLTLAWALRDTPVTKAGDAYFYFRVGLQF
jgi:hemolysin activation/secretion protein